LLAPVSLGAETPPPAPDFKEVYELVHAHLAGVTDVDLNRAAVQGLVAQLGAKVSVVAKEPPDAKAGAAALVTKALTLDGPIAYLRVSRVAEGLDQALTDAYGKLNLTNQTKGLILDLRFAAGQDYSATVSVAELFLKKEKPLLDWGKGMVQSKEKSQVTPGPVAVLVNGQTAGAAEALAAVLRQTGVGLLFGSPTAGQAMMAQEYPLANGDQLRIATAPIVLGDGSKLAGEGVQPDIAVEVGRQDELAYYDEAFKEAARTNRASGSNVLTSTQAASTNRSRRVRFNEAELVRERRDGVYPESDLASGRPADAEAPVVQDPVLARALDVLKGLAVVRASRS
jgi:C-terminal processing protease CtpA/Prc